MENVRASSRLAFGSTVISCCADHHAPQRGCPPFWPKLVHESTAAVMLGYRFRWFEVYVLSERSSYCRSGGS